MKSRIDGSIFGVQRRSDAVILCPSGNLWLPDIAYIDNGIRSVAPVIVVRSSEPPYSNDRSLIVVILFAQLLVAYAVETNPGQD